MLIKIRLILNHQINNNVCLKVSLGNKSIELSDGNPYKRKKQKDIYHSSERQRSKRVNFIVQNWTRGGIGTLPRKTRIGSLILISQPQTLKELILTCLRRKLSQWSKSKLDQFHSHVEPNPFMSKSLSSRKTLRRSHKLSKTEWQYQKAKELFLVVDYNNLKSLMTTKRLFQQNPKGKSQRTFST